MATVTTTKCRRRFRVSSTVPAPHPATSPTGHHESVRRSCERRLCGPPAIGKHRGNFCRRLACAFFPRRPLLSVPSLAGGDSLPPAGGLNESIPKPTRGVQRYGKKGPPPMDCSGQQPPASITLRPRNIFPHAAARQETAGRRAERDLSLLFEP